MKILWICGLPNEVRQFGAGRELCPYKTAAWSWILGHFPPPNGVELHVACPVRGLIENRIDFDYRGVHWHCFREMRGEQYLLRIPVMLRIRAFARQLKPEAIDGWGGETGCGWIATWLSVRATVNVQGLLLLYAQMAKYYNQQIAEPWLNCTVRNLVERMTYRRAAALCVESNLSHDALKSFYRHESQIVYQPLRPEFRAIRERVSSQHPPSFLFVGEFVSRKGAVDTVQAFAHMKCSDATLTMVGGGEQESELKTLVSEIGLMQRVRFMGGLSAEELICLMGNSDFFILPSYGDTGPTALKEALSQGLYPICYDNTGPKELIGRYEFGRLCKTGNWESLVLAMDDACVRRDKLVAQGREVAQKIRYDLSPEAIWPKRLAIYREVVHA